QRRWSSGQLRDPPVREFAARFPSATQLSFARYALEPPQARARLPRHCRKEGGRVEHLGRPLEIDPAGPRGAARLASRRGSTMASTHTERHRHFGRHATWLACPEMLLMSVRLRTVSVIACVHLRLEQNRRPDQLAQAPFLVRSRAQRRGQSVRKLE